jgi:hypothetical protein
MMKNQRDDYCDENLDRFRRKPRGDQGNPAMQGIVGAEESIFDEEHKIQLLR